MTTRAVQDILASSMGDGGHGFSPWARCGLPPRDLGLHGPGEGCHDKQAVHPVHAQFPKICPRLIRVCGGPPGKSRAA